MAEVGVRALKQNASAVVARAVAGESITITDRGRAVAEMVPLATTPLTRLLESGRARPARRALRDLPAPEPGPALSSFIAADRDEDRY